MTVRIVERLENVNSQSGICFRVHPPLQHGTSDTLYDADWFTPVQHEGEHYE